ncbi:MAG: hypothetical protein JXR95_00205 [Deltaproteobacteria bacterium]|nr:hypothetical protein [Deltaproteobacteria bacterium]
MIKNIFSHITGFFVTDWQLKIMSLFLAVVLFFIVRSDKDAEGTLYVDVVYVNKPANHMILNDLNYNLKLVVRGPWTIIKKLNKKQYEKPLSIDLSRVVSDRYELDSTMFDLPRGMKVSSISPQYLPIKMEAVLKRVIPMNIRVNPGRFFQVSEIKITPDKFKISGPKSMVISITEIPLPPLHIQKEGITEKDIPIPELGPNITIEPNLSKVHVKVFVEKAVSTKKFPGLEVGISSGSIDTSGLKISPSTVTVIVEGDKKSLFSLPPSFVKPVVYLSRHPGEETLNLNVTVKGLSSSFNYRVIPNKVKVTGTVSSGSDDTLNNPLKKKPLMKPQTKSEKSAVKSGMKNEKSRNQ